MNSLIINTRINASEVVKGAKEITRALAKTAQTAGKFAVGIGKAQFSLIKTVGKVAAGIGKMHMSLLKSFGSGALSKSLLVAQLAADALKASIKFVVQAMKEGIQNLARFNNGNNELNQSVSAMRTEMLRLKNSIGTAFAPLITMVEPAITRLISLMADATTRIGMFFAALSGKSSFTKAVTYQQDYAKSLNKTGAAAKKTKNQLAGIYDLNNISRNDDSGGGGTTTQNDPNQMFEVVEVDSKIAQVAEKVRAFVDGAKAKIHELWTAFTENWFVQDMMARWKTIKEAFGNMTASLREKWDGFVEKIQARKETLNKIWDAILKTFQIVAIEFQIWIQFIIGAFAPFAEAIGNIITHIIDIFGGLIDFIAGVFTGDWKRAWNGLCNIFIGIINVILDAYEGFVNMLIGGINAISVDVPDWMPGIGGKHIGFNLEELHIPRIPMLAEGTVVPRQSREFAAILGDNNREAEVVSPLSTMKQAFKEAIAEANIGGSSVVKVVLEGDAEGIFKVVRTEEEKNYNRTGNLAFVH